MTAGDLLATATRLRDDVGAVYADALDRPHVDADRDAAHLAACRRALSDASALVVWLGHVDRGAARYGRREEVRT